MERLDLQLIKLFYLSYIPSMQIEAFKWSSCQQFASLVEL